MTETLRQPLLPISPSRVLPIFPTPLAVEDSDPLGEARTRQWLWLFLALGVAARVIRYALRFPLWEDEAFLSANLLHRGFPELAGPLDYFQVCPLGFLWVQWAVVKLLGFNEYALRLVPLLCGVASLFLFRHLAGRFLKGAALVLAVAIFSVSYPCIRYAAEAKQYGVELFVSLVLLTLAVEWWRRPDKTVWLWALAAVAPAAVWLCYPAAFVGAAISLFVAWVLLRGRGVGNGGRGDEGLGNRDWGLACGPSRQEHPIPNPQSLIRSSPAPRPRRRFLPWLAFTLALAASAVSLYVVSAQHQRAKSLQTMQRSWDNAFPPVTRPLALLGWLVDTHTGNLLAYPVGGRNGGSTVTLILCTVALVFLVRRRRWAVLALWLGPLALSLAAAILHLYPYGRMAKFQLFAAPAICLLAGLGTAAFCRTDFKSVLRGAGGRKLRPAAMWIGLGLLAAIGLGSIGRDLIVPAKSPAAMRARDFARWFWFTAEYDGEVVCLRTDLGETFSPGTFEWGLSAMYLCNQRIYSPRHAGGDPVEWNNISADRPLRCVEYRGSEFPYDQAARDRWLQSMESRYQLVGRERYAFAQANDGRQAARDLDYVEVYKFVPRDGWRVAGGRWRVENAK